MQVQISGGIQSAQIARSKPTVGGKRRRALLRQMMVTGEDVGTAGQHFAVAMPCLRRGNGKLHARQRLARRVQPTPARHIPGQDGRCLGESVATGHLPAQGLQQLCHVR